MAYKSNPTSDKTSHLKLMITTEERRPKGKKTRGNQTSSKSIMIPINQRTYAKMTLTDEKRPKIKRVIIKDVKEKELSKDLDGNKKNDKTTD